MPFTTSGIAAELDKLNKLADSFAPACQRAVKAGGKVLAKALSDAAPVRTGGLRKSIKAGSVKYSATDGYTCEVAPHGKHSETGEPLAKIGNILEYGRSNMPPNAWFNPTIDKAAQAVEEAMRAELQKAQEG